MCTQATAKRIRRQASKGFSHLAKQQRPNYRKVSIQKSAARMARLVEKSKLIQTRKGEKK